MHPIIRVQNVCKSYRLGSRQANETFRESILSAMRAPVDLMRRRNKPKPETLWALRDISFDVHPGEVLGVIGRNGAGKSTLLKILSRITEPTSGRVELYGRMGSLLEVGTGFHTELTGRENIYLNGAILGMKRSEIDSKFDEIVSFAEIDKFLDTPVKHYSSGMYMRLAFAVAAHLESEILVVDEVLAVGDATFQKKCLSKMGEVAYGGRTVLFVSHNMAAVEALCSRCILVDQGQMKADGEPRDLVQRYFVTEQRPESAARSLVKHSRRTRGSEHLMKEVTCLSGLDEPTISIGMSESLKVKVAFASESQPLQPVLGLVIKSAVGVPIFGVNNRFIRVAQDETPMIAGTVCCSMEKLPLMPGSYYIDLYFGNRNRDLDVIEEAVSFEVLPGDVYGTGQIPPSNAGSIFWPAKFCFSRE